MFAVRWRRPAMLSKLTTPTAIYRSQANLRNWRNLFAFMVESFTGPNNQCWMLTGSMCSSTSDYVNEWARDLWIDILLACSSCRRYWNWLQRAHKGSVLPRVTQWPGRLSTHFTCIFIAYVLIVESINVWLVCPVNFLVPIEHTQVLNTRECVIYKIFFAVTKFCDIINVLLGLDQMEIVLLLRPKAFASLNYHMF
jgi:hypothetical protein